MRTGLIGQKVGMTSVFREDGRRLPVTIVKVDSCQVVDKKLVDKHGYLAVVVGAKQAKPTRVTKPMQGIFTKNGVIPRVKLKEFRVSEEHSLEIGVDLTVEHFSLNQRVDVTGTTIGKGFAGSMKRWNFSGQEASHGVSVTHRAHGSTGGRQDPGKVFKNKKMAGHLGCEQVTVQNLRIVLIDSEKQVLGICGNVPGAKNSFVYIRDAVKYR